MKQKFSLALLFFFTLTLALSAQESRLINGQVVSAIDGLPIPGVNILILDTSTGTNTDFDGNFQIQVKQGDVLQFSYLGFETQIVIITDQTTLSVSLSEDASALEEVVVVGYGTQKKSNLTGSISKVVNDDLDQIAVSRVDDALVGQVSGVNIQSTEGEAGSAPTIRIRGTGSISSSSSPLIVVDGLVVDEDFLGNLDMNDIQSFEVLKDAASSAIFGSRGANGVIQITTKSGKSGKTKFTYNTYKGFKEARQSDAYSLSVGETAAKELEYTGTLSDKTRYKQILADINGDLNWQDIIFDGGEITSHSFAARGGNEKTRYSTSMAYLHDEGVLLTDDYKKYNLKLKLDHKFNNKLSSGISLTPSYSDKRRFDGSTHDILRQPSWLPLRVSEAHLPYVNRVRDNGAYANVQVGDYATQRMFDDYDLAAGVPVVSGTDISNTSNTNPGAKVLERNRTEDKLKFYGSAFLQYQINDNFTFKTTISGDYQNTRKERLQGELAHRNGAANMQTDFERLNVSHLVSDNLLTYNKVFNDVHEVNAILGVSSELEKGDYTATRIVGYDAYNHSFSDATSVGAGNDLEYKKSLFAYYARVNYAYDNKYLVSLSFRRDGSSIFGQNNKYGTFPAVSAGWNIHKEDFLSSSDLVSQLKLRASYGVTGTNDLRLASFNVLNDDALINYYPSIPLLSNSSYDANGSMYALNIANPDLKWERSIEINPGVDFGLFNNKITGSIDYYKRTSDQLLLYNPVSSTTGFTNALVNIGEVENSGIEFELRTRNISNENFQWSTTILASRNKNELTDFASSNGQIQSVDSKRAAEWINLQGNPISSFYGWVVDEEIPLEYLSNPFHPIGATAQDVYVKDLNGDGLIDDDDKTILGNPYPDFVWSLTNDFRIGAVDVSFMFQGSHGAEVRNMADQYMFNHFNSAQDFISSTPNQGFIKQKIFTNSIIQDASYVALRTVNIGYTLPSNLVNQLRLSSARIYATGQNLLYFTADGYTGWNPESVNTTSATTYGYQLGGSPIQQTISVGVNVEF